MAFMAGIECGGTTFKVSTARFQGNNTFDRLDTTIIDTTMPEETLKKMVLWLKEQEQKHHDEFKSIGIACFGPVDLDKNSETYGFITTTPKPHWGNVDIVGALKKAFPNVPVAFETDVNAPAFAELVSKAHGNVNSLAYVTVGTGIGVGLALDGQPVHGLVHPEGGHIYVPLCEADIKSGNTKGTCPFHGPCLEGLCNGISIAKRKQINISQIKDLADDDEIWDIASHYYAMLCVNLILITSVEVIVLGGGIFQRKILFDKVRKHTVKMLNGYISKVNSETIDKQIKESAFGADAGIFGAFYLAVRDL